MVVNMLRLSVFLCCKISIPNPHERACTAHLVQSSDKTSVVVEGRHDKGVVLLVNIQDGLDVHLGILHRTTEEDGKQETIALFLEHSAESSLNTLQVKRTKCVMKEKCNVCCA